MTLRSEKAGKCIGFLNRRISPPTLAAAGISLIIFTYVAMRAANIPITHDEALTYAWHVTGGWRDIVLFRTTGLPDNNHVLYTLLCKISVKLFGVSELTLRLPSILGCLLYLIGLNLCLKRMIPGWRQVLGILAVGTNPYVLDFLGLARGYGLGLGFTMIGLNALLAAFAESPGKILSLPLKLSLLFFTLATLSNLSFLLVLAAALLIISLSLAYGGTSLSLSLMPDESPWAVLLKILLSMLPLFAYLIIPLSIIHHSKLFEMGGSTGFWPDTVGSLIEGTMYDTPLLAAQKWLLEIWLSVTLLFLPLGLWVLHRWDKRRFTALMVMVTLIGIIVLESLAQHLLFNVAFLQGRRGIFLIPLFLLVALVLGHLPRATSRWIGTVGLLVGVLVPAALGVNGLLSANLRYVYDWKSDAGTREIMLAVKKKIDRQKPSLPLRMRVNWNFEPGTNFYRHTMGIESSLLPLNREGLDGSADLYYGMREDDATIMKYSPRLIFRDSVSDTALFERVNKRFMR
ncbi:MAG: hypothetical protein WCI01_02610 [Chlorobiaceae bacterium]